MAHLVADIKDLDGVPAELSNSGFTQDLKSTANTVTQEVSGAERKAGARKQGELSKATSQGPVPVELTASVAPATTATPCTQDYPVSGAFSGSFDYTSVAVLSDSQNDTECDVSVTDDGLASKPVFGFIPPIIPGWVDAVYSIPSSTFATTSAMAAAANDSSQACMAYGESSQPVGTSVVLPPPSYVDWLTDPVATAISAGANAAFNRVEASTPSDEAVPMATPALYMSRAFSGGGLWTGSGSLNPYELNNTCLVSAVPDGESLNTDGEELNFILILFDAISPIVNLNQTVQDNGPCVSTAIQAAFGAAAQAIGSTGTTSSGVTQALENFLWNEYQAISSQLLGCESSQAVSNTLESFIGKSTSDLLDKGFATADEAGALLTLGNLEEYGHAVESAFVPIDSPFSAGSSSSPSGSPPANGASSAWLGMWAGTINQPGAYVNPWKLTMNINSLTGGIAGTYDEPDLKCSGTLSFISATTDELQLSETVVEQPPPGTPWYCVGGPITLSATGNDTATYSWSSGAAYGPITRQSSSSSSESLTPWLGDWRGAVTQTPSVGAPDPYDVSYDVVSGTGISVGTWSSQDLECSGSLSIVSVNAEQLVLDVQITNQPPAGTSWSCVGGTATMDATGSGSASIDVVTSAGTGSGTLSR
jgi:hypothetical protein